MKVNNNRQNTTQGNRHNQIFDTAVLEAAVEV
jgi:hypothetical protein